MYNKIQKQNMQSVIHRFIDDIGMSSYADLPHFPDDINVKNQCGSYYQVLPEDMKYDIGIQEMFHEDKLCRINIALKKGNTLRVFHILEHGLSCCRHGRPLIDGPFTAIIIPYQHVHNNPLFLPLSEFIKSCKQSVSVLTQ